PNQRNYCNRFHERPSFRKKILQQHNASHLEPLIFSAADQQGLDCPALLRPKALSESTSAFRRDTTKRCSRRALPLSLSKPASLRNCSAPSRHCRSVLSSARAALP